MLPYVGQGEQQASLFRNPNQDKQMLQVLTMAERNNWKLFISHTDNFSSICPLTTFIGYFGELMPNKSSKLYLIVFYFECKPELW